MPPHRTPRNRAYRSEQPAHHDAWTVAAVLVLALALRTAWMLALKATPFFFNHFSDSRIYADLARAISEGTLPDRAYFMSPLYPYLLAGVSAFGAPELWMRVLQVGFGCATVFLVMETGRDLFGRRAGTAAGLFAAISPVLIRYDSALLSESLLILAVAAHAYALQRALREESARMAALAGFAAGVMLVSRFGLLPVLALEGLFLFVIRRHPMRMRGAGIALFIGMACLVVLPWTIRNAAVEGVFVPVTASGGFNLHAGNNMSSIGLYDVPEDVDLYADPNGARFASESAGRELSSTEVSSFWSDRAWEWIGTHPVAALLLYGRKLLLFFSPQEIEQLGISGSFLATEYGGIFSIPLPGFFAVFLLAAAGIAAADRTQTRTRLMLLIAAAFVLSTAVFFVNGRLRAPLLPVLLPFAGLAVDAAIRAFRSGSWRVLLRPVLAVSVVGLGVGVLSPAVPVRFDMEYSRLGQIAFDAGDSRTALQYYTRSIAERPSAVAMTNKGNAYAALGRMNEAGACYDSALALNPRFVLAWFNAGNLALQRGDAPGALRRWMQAATLQPGFAPAWRNAGLLLLRAGRNANALDAFTRASRAEADPAARAELERMTDEIRRQVAAQNSASSPGSASPTRDPSSAGAGRRP